MCKAILIATNRKHKNQFGAESSCVKFQNRPYKASHSEYNNRQPTTSITVPVRKEVSTDHLHETTYRGKNGHVTDDVT